ncbi:Bifunctional polymyxin resistance protein ArnA [subsurface metagenome]
MVVPRFIKQALSGEPITIYGDGNQTRCFGYIEDIVNALIGLMGNSKAYGQIFNVGSDEEISIKELAQKIKGLTEGKSRIDFIPYEEVYGLDFEDMLHRRPDLSKLKETIGYQPKFTLEESLKKIIDYFNVS